MSDWDDDIAKMPLTHVEKNGLQIYRNYTRAFEDRLEKEFAAKVADDTMDLGRLQGLLSSVVEEDARYIPVIACAYADEVLQSTFKAEVPEEIPGGRSALFGPYGPLSSLFNRIQVAHAFDMLSRDLLKDLDLLRRARNEISHTWNVDQVRYIAERKPLSELTGVDAIVLQAMPFLPDTYAELSPVKKLKIRVSWIMCRLTYEGPFYSKAKRSRLNPVSTLYGVNHPSCLSAISALAVKTTHEVLNRKSPSDLKG